MLTSGKRGEGSQRNTFIPPTHSTTNRDKTLKDTANTERQGRNKEIIPYHRDLEQKFHRPQLRLAKHRSQTVQPIGNKNQDVVVSMVEGVFLFLKVILHRFTFIQILVLKRHLQLFNDPPLKI